MAAGRGGSYRTRMLILVRLIQVCFGIYAAGLLAYMILSWVRGPQVEGARRWLGRFYAPFLLPLRQAIKPVPVAGALLDLSPAVLLLAILFCRSLVIYVLIGVW